MIVVNIEAPTDIEYVIDQDYFDGSKTYEEALKQSLHLEAGQKFSYDDTAPNAQEIGDQL